MLALSNIIIAGVSLDFKDYMTKIQGWVLSLCAGGCVAEDAKYGDAGTGTGGQHMPSRP